MNPPRRRRRTRPHHLSRAISCQLKIEYTTSNEVKGCVQDFRDVKTWQRAHELTLSVYQITAMFQKEELYGLTSQLRRCSASIAANIAEGCGRNGDAEFARFCSIAMGSASELEYHLLLAKDLKLIAPKAYSELSERAVELKRMLSGLLQKLKASRSEPQVPPQAEPFSAAAPPRLRVQADS